MCPITYDRAVNRLRYVVKIVYIFFLVLVHIATLAQLIMLRSGFVPVYFNEDPLILITEISMSGFSILCLIIGLSFPRLAGWHKKAHVSVVQVLYGHVIMAGFFFSIAMFGLFMGIFGVTEFLVLPLFMLSATALFITFPTSKRLAKWQGKQKKIAFSSYSS